MSYKTISRAASELALIVMVVVQKPLAIIFDAFGRFFERVRGWLNHAGWHGPRSGKHVRVVDDCLPDKVFAVPPQSLRHMYCIGVEIPLFTKPAVFDEIPDIHSG